MVALEHYAARSKKVLKDITLSAFNKACVALDFRSPSFRTLCEIVKVLLNYDDDALQRHMRFFVRATNRRPLRGGSHSALTHLRQNTWECFLDFIAYLYISGVKAEDVRNVAERLPAVQEFLSLCAFILERDLEWLVDEGVKEIYGGTYAARKEEEDSGAVRCGGGEVAG